MGGQGDLMPSWWEKQALGSAFRGWKQQTILRSPRRTMRYERTITESVGLAVVGERGGQTYSAVIDTKNRGSLYETKGTSMAFETKCHLCG